MFLREAVIVVKKSLLGTLPLLLTLLPVVVHSANSAQSKISIVVGESAKISAIDDWVIGIHAAGENMSSFWEYQWDYECVFSSTGAYSVELNSQNGSSPLELRNNSGVSLDYELWAYVKNGASYSMKGPYTTASFSISNLTGSDSQTCQGEGYGGHNLFFAALVRQSNFNAAPTGIYRDQMIITVRPE